MDEIEGLGIVEHHLRERELVGEPLMATGRIEVGMMPSPRDAARLPVLGRLVGHDAGHRGVVETGAGP